MMLFSSTEAVSTAKATKIIADFTHIRKAVLAWYFDNMDRITYASKETSGKDLKFFFNNVRYNSIQDVFASQAHSYQTVSGVNKNQTVSFMSYLHGATSFNDKAGTEANNWNYLADGGYGVNDAGTEEKRDTWFAGYRFKAGEDVLKRKLWGRKNALGLIFSKGVRPNNGSPIQHERDVSSAKSVWLRIRGDAKLDGKDGALNDKS